MFDPSGWLICLNMSLCIFKQNYIFVNIGCSFSCFTYKRRLDDRTSFYYAS